MDSRSEGGPHGAGEGGVWMSPLGERGGKSGVSTQVK